MTMPPVLNAAALAHRAALPAANDFSIGQLRGLPSYFGWVDCMLETGTFKMLLGGHDDGVALRFFWNGGYEKTTLRTWARFAQRVELALDVGAHTGVYTLAAKIANPDVSVAAFEPHFMNFARLNLNLRVNGLNTANAFMLAIGAKDEQLPFSVDTSAAAADVLSTGGALGVRKNAETTTVKVVRLDGFIPDALKPKVGLVKIDVEGAEAACFAGMGTILSRARPIIFFECLEDSVGAAVMAVLSPLGYRFFDVDDTRDTIVPATKVVAHRDDKGRLVYGRFNRIALPPGVELPQ
jgi:FkbM family methyltransferase